VNAATTACSDDHWMRAMRSGDLQAAWEICDAVLRRRVIAGEVSSDRPRHLQFVWRGQALAGKSVLVRCYHGLGDTIQFLRFMRMLRAVAGHVEVWVQPALLDLAARAEGVDAVLPLHDGTPDAQYEVDIEIMEVPHALRVTSIPNHVPYLSVPLNPRFVRPGDLTVGVVWKAGTWDERRSIPGHLISRIGQVTGTRLLSLQKTDPVWSIESERKAMNGTAARICELDLVISVDTMVAHLAGALARPVWTLLHADCDWRWGDGDRSSVWYPTMRLFRQSRAGDWTSVIESVCEELDSLARSKQHAVR
jgi:hypothetical protein